MSNSLRDRQEIIWQEEKVQLEDGQLFPTISDQLSRGQLFVKSNFKSLLELLITVGIPHHKPFGLITDTKSGYCRVVIPYPQILSR